MFKAQLSEFPKLRTDEGFLREAFIALAKNKETPEDIFDAVFEDVKTENRRYAFSWGSSEIKYTCAVGYKKKIKFKKYNDITKKFETKIEEQVDWTPMSGSYSGTGRSYVKNCIGRTFGGELENARKLLGSSDVTQIASNEGEKAVISDSEQAAIYKEIASDVADSCRRGLPGDKLKDFHYSYNSYIDGTKVYEIPVQILEYEYKNEKYVTYGFSVGNIPVDGYHPVDDESDKARRDERARPFVLATLGACLVSTAVSLFCPIFILSLLCFLAAAGVAAYTWVNWNVALKNFRKETQKKKINHLNKVFKKLGFEELTQAEMNVIEGGIK